MFKLLRKNSAGVYANDESIEATKEATRLTLADGTLTITGLPSGDYKLTEVTPPDGYIIEYDAIYFTVNATGTGEVITTTNDQKPYTELGGVTATGTNNNTLVIPNTPGVALPRTGGMGTRLYLLGGGAIVLLAAVWLLLRRRRNA